MSFRTLITAGKTTHVDKDLLAFARHLLNGQSAVVGANDFLTQQTDPVGMSIQVGAGVIYSYIAADDTYYPHKLTDTTTTLSIDPNSSGATRIDLLCVKTDMTVTPDLNGEGRVSLVIVKGTPGAGVPTAPANHDVLYEVSVANGAVSITNANLTDKRKYLTLTSAARFGGAGLKMPASDGTTGQALVTDGQGNLSFGGGSDGWVTAGETVTYASATTLTVAGDQTAKYSKGTRIKFTQATGGTKCFVVKSSSYSAPTTTITLFETTNHTLVNEAITNPYYSYALNPQGFPEGLTIASLWSEITLGNGTYTGKIWVRGNRIRLETKIVFGTTTSITGNPHVMLPVVPVNKANMGQAYLEDVGTNQHQGVALFHPSLDRIYPRTGSSSTTAIGSTSPFTWANTDILAISIEYEF